VEPSGNFVVVKNAIASASVANIGNPASDGAFDAMPLFGGTCIGAPCKSAP
jgi:hypothetical protein